jgi:hypothetical protein
LDASGLFSSGSVKGQWEVLVNTVLKLPFHGKAGNNFGAFRQLLASEKEPCFTELVMKERQRGEYSST